MSARPPLARLLALACSLAALLSLARPARAADCPPEAGDCTSVLSSGSLGASIDLVILGDGYTAAERDKFLADAAKVANGLLGSDTYKAYRPVFNAWSLFTASPQSGADHPSTNTYVDTAYDAEYEAFGISQLLIVNNSKVLVDINKRFPEADLLLCLVNDTTYGGSGGGVAVISTDANALEIARHEIGHILANLADEYSDPYPGYPEGDPEPNVASAEHLDPLKWQSWLTSGVAIPTPIGDKKGPHDPIGAYEGARYKATGVFRPAPTCIMRELNVTFCPVCAEAMVLNFSRLSLLIDAPSPASGAVIPAEGQTAFSATIPSLTTLVYSWKIDDMPVAETGQVLDLDPQAAGLADGPHKITLTVHDATPLVRDDPMDFMTESFTWDITVEGGSSMGSTTSAGGGGGGGNGGAGGDGGAAGSGGAAPEPGGCGCRAAGQAPSELPSLLGGALAFALVAAALRRRNGGRLR